MGAHRNFSREGQELEDMASAECQPTTGVWAEPLAGSRGRALGRGAKRPVKLKALKHLQGYGERRAPAYSGGMKAESLVRRGRSTP